MEFFFQDTKKAYHESLIEKANDYLDSIKVFSDDPEGSSSNYFNRKKQRIFNEDAHSFASGGSPLPSEEVLGSGILKLNSKLYHSRKSNMKSAPLIKNKQFSSPQFAKSSVGRKISSLHLSEEEEGRNTTYSDLELSESEEKSDVSSYVDIKNRDQRKPSIFSMLLRKNTYENLEKIEKEDSN